MQAYSIKLSMSSLYLKTVHFQSFEYNSIQQEYDVKVLEQILWKIHKKRTFLLFK